MQIIRVKLVVSHRNVDQGGQAPQSVQFKLKTGFPMNNLLPLISHRVSKHLVFIVRISNAVIYLERKVPVVLSS